MTLPPGGEPYQMVEQIRQVVERETEEDAKMAEQDWKRVTHAYGTRAPLRYEVKSRLFKAIVELMHNADKVASA